MDKKDIYEHLANIYLDASLKKKKKNKKYSQKNVFLAAGAAALVLGIFIFTVFNPSRPKNTEIALVIQPNAVKINFHFDPAKKEIYSVGLNKLDLSRFKALGFSLKKTNYDDSIKLRVEFTNTFREKSEVYIKDLSHKWQDYKISLSDFKSIRDWSEMQNLSFIVEEWNAKEKKGIVYIDNVRMLR